MITVNGGCRCRNISITLELTREPSYYSPRTCDCNFCQAHGAAYVSDPAGSLWIHIDQPSDVQRMRQGSMAAEFLVCRCNDLVAVLYGSGEKLLAAVNAKMLEQSNRLGVATPVSPKTLSAEQKVERWKTAWFARVATERGGRDF